MTVRTTARRRIRTRSRDARYQTSRPEPPLRRAHSPTVRKRTTPGSKAMSSSSYKPNAFLGAPYDSQIGATQRTWLKNQLEASTARLKVIFAPRAFKEFWASAEQQEILDWITATSKESLTSAVRSSSRPGTCTTRRSGSCRRPVPSTRCSAALSRILACTRRPPCHRGRRWGYSGSFFNTATGAPGKAISNSIGQIDVDTTGAGTATLRIFNESSQEY